MQFQYNDGGRKEAGFKGLAKDCVTRAIAISTGLEYNIVYEMVDRYGAKEYNSKHKSSKSSARSGVWKPTTRKIMADLGWEWVPTMFVGSGCRVHLKKSELPNGVIMVSLSRHMTTVIDGVINDTYNPSRNETRCVYGYYKKGETK